MIQDDEISYDGFEEPRVADIRRFYRLESQLFERHAAREERRHRLGAYLFGLMGALALTIMASVISGFINTSAAKDFGIALLAPMIAILVTYIALHVSEFSQFDTRDLQREREAFERKQAGSTVFGSAAVVGALWADARWSEWALKRERSGQGPVLGERRTTITYTIHEGAANDEVWFEEGDSSAARLVESTREEEEPISGEPTADIARLEDNDWRDILADAVRDYEVARLGKPEAHLDAIRAAVSAATRRGDV